MRKLFLLGTCRIHRPFQHDDKGRYDLLGSQQGHEAFLSFMYCSAHIRQLLPHLFEDRLDKEYWHRQYPDRLPAIMRAREECRDADLFLIEIASIKYFTPGDGYYLNNEFLKCDRYSSGFVLTADELENLRSIHVFLRSHGKQVMFVSHFNPYAIPPARDDHPNHGKDRPPFL